VESLVPEKPSSSDPTGPTVSADASAPTIASNDALASGPTLAKGSDGSDRPVVRAGRLTGPQSETEWAPGARIGRYVVLARIGAGGMGAVYRAEDVELGRAVALKRLHAGASDDSRARLVREARTAAQLQHANVLTVHEVAEHQGVAFLAMELVDGVTLTQWLKQSVWSWREVVAMLCQAGHGLIAAHDRGLVHRDFKPDNVLVDRAGRARVADFGLARALDDVHEQGGRLVGGDARLARLTETGEIAGTPAYMAPELVEAAPPDARSDQYAFAVTLYEALHGQHPFAGKTAGALWLEMANERVRPGTRTLPARVQRAVRRGLSADPAKRWPDLVRFVRELEAASAPGRRRWYVIGGGVAVSALVATAAIALGRGTVQQPCSEVVRGYDINLTEGALARRGVEPAEIARVNAVVASFKHEAKAQLIDSCMDTRAGRQTAEMASKRAACIERARDRVWSMLDRITDDKQTGAQLASALDDMPDLAQCTDPAWLARPAQAGLSEAQQQALTRAEADVERAGTLRDRGDLAGAEQALDAAEKAAGNIDQHVVTTRVWMLRTEIARDRGNMATARTTSAQAVAEAGLSGDSKLSLQAQVLMLATSADVRTADSFAAITDSDDSLETASLRIAHGDALMESGRLAEGEKEYRRALAIREAKLPPAHLDRALALQRLGAALIIQKRLADARPVVEQAAAAIEKALPPLRREAIDSVRYLAMLEEEAGNLPRALELLHEVADRRSKVLGPTHVMVLDARADIGRVLSDLGDFKHAAEELRTVVDGMITAMGDKSYNAADARVSLANALISSGDFANADTELAAATPLIAREKGAESPYTLVADYAQARSWLERPTPVKLDEAAAILDRAGPVFVKLFGEASQPAAAVAITRARLDLARGDAKQADELASRAISMLDDTKRGDRGEARAVHAAILWKLGSQAAARTAAQSAIADFEAAGPWRAAQAVALRAWLSHPTTHPAWPVPVPPSR
jgi:serine/threonine protein kinase/tetratricopeptide (TPR) repeat protein